ncbi:MAG: hypothetical protein KAY37_03395 [Phycisphaerae bacterium]|nr:hypothetical protein [Phycisphaerae bacterium]
MTLSSVYLRSVCILTVGALLSVAGPRAANAGPMPPLLVPLIASAGPSLDTPSRDVLGDSNCDGIVNACDIDYFIAALNDNIAAWEAMFLPGEPTCPFSNNDVNDDGIVDWLDMDPFMAIVDQNPRGALSPNYDFDAYGLVGGPFVPPSGWYVVSNCMGDSRNWTAGVSYGDWFIAIPSNGTLPPGGFTLLEIRYTAAAYSLPVGDHSMLLEVAIDYEYGLPDYRGLTLHVLEENPVEPHCDGGDCGEIGDAPGCEPVQLFSGAFVKTVTDLRIPGAATRRPAIRR